MDEKYPAEHSEARPFRPVEVTPEDVRLGRASVNSLRESMGYDQATPAVRNAIETPWNIMGEELHKLDESIAQLGHRIGFILKNEEPSDPGMSEKRPGGGEVSELQQEMWSRVDWIRRINEGVNSLIRRVDL